MEGRKSPAHTGSPSPMKSPCPKQFLLLNFMKSTMPRRNLLVDKKKSPRREPRTHPRKKRTHVKSSRGKRIPAPRES